MRTPIVLAALIAAAAPVLAQPAAATASAPIATKGQMLTGADHSRLGSVVRVADDGSVAIIFDAQLVTVPASTLTVADGKLVTSLSKHDLTAMR